MECINCLCEVVLLAGNTKLYEPVISVNLPSEIFILSTQFLLGRGRGGVKGK